VGYLPIVLLRLVAFASPGRVEGASETTQVGAAADGILKAVYVKEDQFVRRGTYLARSL